MKNRSVNHPKTEALKKTVGKEECFALGARVPKSARNKLKIYCATNETTMSEVLTDLINRL